MDATPVDLQHFIVEHGGDLITAVDIDGQITFASSGWRRLGWEPDALVGRRILDLLHPDDAAAAAQKMADRSAGDDSSTLRSRFRCADGSYRLMESSGSALYDADGAPVAIVGTARDISDREELRARAAELRAVNRLADAVARSSTLEELLDEAVDAILAGVGASRASVLISDDDGVMRFRAWRGLSDTYRAFTEGHSPWPADAADPQPVLVVDALLADFERGLADTVRREGIRALAFIPLVHGGTLLGKFMVYFDEPHELTDSELRLCRTMAHHIASSTARFRARDQLRESLALVDSLFDAAPAGLAYWDLALRYMRVNNALAQMNGIAAEDHIGRYVFDVFPAFEEQLAGVFRHVLETGESVLDLEVDGETPANPGAQRWFRTSWYPVRDPDGSMLGVGGVITDVTTERLAQRAAEERAHAADALEFVDDGVFLVGHDSVIRLWNPAAARVLGVPTAGAVGRRIDEAVPGFETHSGPQILIVAGEERHLSVSSVAYPGGTVYAVRDVTEEERVERAKSDFIATVSHELRTPLAAVYGAAVTLRRPDISLGDPERERFLEMIVSETDRLARIVNDILWASRLDSGTVRVQREPVDLPVLVASVVDAARSYAPDDIVLAIDIPESIGAFATDPDKLRQVLTNLVQNAVKYSPGGGRVDVSAASAPGRVRFVVRDEGLGVPPSEQERIWEKFVRLDPNLSRGVGGTGLGLYITRELVRRLGGSISVASDGIRGSAFSFDLPRS